MENLLFPQIVILIEKNLTKREYEILEEYLSVYKIKDYDKMSSLEELPNCEVFLINIQKYMFFYQRHFKNDDKVLKIYYHTLKIIKKEDYQQLKVDVIKRCLFQSGFIPFSKVSVIEHLSINKGVYARSCCDMCCLMMCSKITLNKFCTYLGKGFSAWWGYC